MFTSYHQFVSDRYNQLSDQVREAFGSECRFRQAHAEENGFTPWLEENRGKSIDTNEVHSVAETYVSYGERSPQDIPQVLGLLMRCYDIEMPAFEGMFKEAYWSSFFAVKSDECTKKCLMLLLPKKASAA